MLALFAPAAIATALAWAIGGCSSDESPGPSPAPRTYLMGFSPIPPNGDPAMVAAAVAMWSQRADAGLLSGEPPWDSLLAGVPADSLVIRNYVPVANWFRGLGLTLVVNVDPTNGLDRSSDAAALVAAGRSLTEPAIQDLFRAFATAADTIIHPAYLGLASETNLVRALAPASLYAAVVQVANATSSDVRTHDGAVQLFSTVQVETAWGWVTPGGGYQGTAQDRSDFGFDDVLGLSSYPYFVYALPESLPPDYYSRLIATDRIPVMVIEGGWTSETVTSMPSTPADQARYIRRHAALLDGVDAIGWFQLTFTDLDLTFWPPAVAPFAHLGLVGTNLAAKPALAEWDATFRRPLAR